jgi:hypothetical protein
VQQVVAAAKSQAAGSSQAAGKPQPNCHPALT